MRRELCGRQFLIAVVLVLGGGAATPALGQSGGDFDLAWSTVDGGGRTSISGIFMLSGTVGQADVESLVGGAFELRGGFWPGTAGGQVPCTTAADCGDQDDDGIRDDVCSWHECLEGGICDSIAKSDPADMAGQFGACLIDGTADGNDRFMALGCFSNVWPGGAGEVCEQFSPSAINVDAGGPFGTCGLDGTCDGNDAFAALNSFSGVNTCSSACAGGPAPGGPGMVEVVDSTRVSLKAVSHRGVPGDEVAIDVYFDDAVSDLRGYQLHLKASGGQHGQLDLVDIVIEPRKDMALHADWTAFNKHTGQVVAGLDGSGVATGGPVYLATYTYRISGDARGTFVVDLLHDDDDPAQRTFLFATPANGKVDIVETQPAIIEVGRSSAR